MLSFDATDELGEFRLSEPDPMGLMDVIELIAPGARVTGWERMGGGMDAAMHRVAVSMPSGADTAFVLRRHDPASTTAEHAAREAETLEKLRATHVPAPELLWLDAGGHVFGCPALAITLLPGLAAVTTADPVRWARALAEPLGAIHLIPPALVDHLPVDEEPEALWARLTAVKEPREDDAIDTGAILTALEQAVDDVPPGDLRLVHGDYHGAQVLRGDGHEVVGVVDWLHARVGDPRWDVASAHFDTWLVHGPAAAEAFVQRYVDLTGRDLSPWWWWRMLAVAASLPDPALWGEAMRESGAEVTDESLRTDATAYVEACLRDRDTGAPDPTPATRR